MGPARARPRFAAAARPDGSGWSASATSRARSSRRRRASGSRFGPTRRGFGGRTRRRRRDDKRPRQLLAAPTTYRCTRPRRRKHTGMIGEAELRAMKPTAYLINTSRGALIDEAALARALNEGWIAGAALDVLAEEPPPRPTLARARQCDRDTTCRLLLGDRDRGTGDESRAQRGERPARRGSGQASIEPGGPHHPCLSPRRSSLVDTASDGRDVATRVRKRAGARKTRGDRSWRLGARMSGGRPVRRDPA